MEGNFVASSTNSCELIVLPVLAILEVTSSKGGNDGPQTRTV